MDVQFWIYIIIGLIYFLSKLLKKPEQPPEGTNEQKPAGRPARQRGEVVVESERPLTFEELLREITEGKQPVKRVPPPRPVYENYDENLEEEARSLEAIPSAEDDARVFKAYEDAKNSVNQRASLEETMRLEDTVIEFGKFKVFEEEKKRNLSDEYMRIFRSSGGLKQAVVMSEILKRKF